jgi:hypothetical protein
MKKPSELTRAELDELVGRIQEELFLERDEVDEGEQPRFPARWNFTKMHDYSELLQHLADTMDSHGLAPDYASHPSHWR